METTTDKCAICYDDIIGKKNRITTGCDHHFHATCMIDYARNADVPTIMCPVCRHPLFDVSDVESADEEAEQGQPLSCGQVVGGIALVMGTLLTVNTIISYCTP